MQPVKNSGSLTGSFSRAVLTVTHDIRRLDTLDCDWSMLDDCAYNIDAPDHIPNGVEAGGKFLRNGLYVSRVYRDML